MNPEIAPEYAQWKRVDEQLTAAERKLHEVLVEGSEDPTCFYDAVSTLRAESRRLLDRLSELIETKGPVTDTRFQSLS